MKELSIFIDESGDFGEYAPHSPYYIITMVFHNQKENIQPSIAWLNQELSYLNLNDLCIHTGPIIRREEIYENMSVKERRRIFNKMVAFIRQINIRYKCFYIEKAHISNATEATEKLAHALLPNPIFRKVMPTEYKLLQAADLLCTIELVKLKLVHNLFSTSEMIFFGSIRDLKKNYIKPLSKKEWI